MPSEFEPETEAARRIVTSALADHRAWLDPIEVKRLLDAYHIAAVPTFAAADAEEAVAHASAIFAHDYIRQHRHLFHCLRIFEHQNRIVKVEVDLVLVEYVKGHQIVPPEAQVLKCRLQSL